VSPQWLIKELSERYDCKLTPSGITRLIQRLHPEMEKRSKGRPKIYEDTQLYNSCGGFELIIALAYHLGWPQITANTIKNTIKSLKHRFSRNEKSCSTTNLERLSKYIISIISESYRYSLILHNEKSYIT